jgi:phage shock protein A
MISHQELALIDEVEGGDVIAHDQLVQSAREQSREMRNEIRETETEIRETETARETETDRDREEGSGEKEEATSSGICAPHHLRADIS